jgi:hypothetical protein
MRSSSPDSPVFQRIPAHHRRIDERYRLLLLLLLLLLPFIRCEKS